MSDWPNGQLHGVGAAEEPETTANGRDGPASPPTRPTSPERTQEKS